jgi:hypothetical protein
MPNFPFGRSLATLALFCLCFAGIDLLDGLFRDDD